MRYLFILVFLLLLAACAPGGPADPPAPALEGYPARPADLPRAEVLRVVDGDTVDVDLGGRRERVRLIGIDTPESVDPRRPVECYGREASANAKALLEGQAVYLEEDPTQDSRDRNGRLLRFVWLEDGRMVNLEQIRGGFAFEYTFDRPYRYRDAFRDAAGAARAAGAGLWAGSTCDGQSRPADQADPPAAAPAVDALACGAPAVPGAAPDAPVRIASVNKRDEVVELENVGAAPVDLSGWRLCSLRGGEAQAGIGGSLAPGERRAFANPGEPIWSNGQPDSAALYDAEGNLISVWEDR